MGLYVGLTLGDTHKAALRWIQLQAKNLINAGYQVTVWNRSADKCKPLEDLGAKVSFQWASHSVTALLPLLSFMPADKSCQHFLVQHALSLSYLAV